MYISNHFPRSTFWEIVGLESSKAPGIHRKNSMVGLVIRALCLIATLCLPIPSWSAEISAEYDSSSGITFIAVTGELETGDDLKFVQTALPVQKAVVLFNSYGGKLSAGLGIGRAIRLKEFQTAVAADSVCASACALAWLAGTRRYVDEKALVGFHAASIQREGTTQETGSGNALTGAYLNQLGLTQSAIYYITEKAPHEMNWLSRESAMELGIEITILSASETKQATRDDGRIPESTSLQPPSAQGIKRIQFSDIFGFDLPAMPILNATLESCEQACTSNSACKAFTFNRGNSACYLKSDGYRVLGNRLADAGYKIEIEARLRKSPMTVFEKTDLPGGDYMDLSELSFEQCTEACELDNRCAAFTYGKGRMCWLKSSVPNAKADKSVISGVKDGE